MDMASLQDIGEKNLKLYRAMKNIFSSPDGELVFKTLEAQCGIYECSPYQTYDESMFFNNGQKFSYTTDPYYLMYKTGQIDMFLFIKKFLDMSETEFMEKNNKLFASMKDNKDYKE